MADPILKEAIEKLIVDNKLHKGDTVILWGMGVQTGNLIEELQTASIHIEIILDNFKDTFTSEYQGIHVLRAKAYFEKLKEENRSCPPVLLAINYANAVVRQLLALGAKEIYNLRELNMSINEECSNIAFTFENRIKGKNALCYILAGYEQAIWDSTLARIEMYQSDKYDYCLISSGKYDAELSAMAARNGWSYLSTSVNQVCYIQNLVIELHPQAEYILKMDEDMFVGNGFFDRMLKNYIRIEGEGDYRIGFAVPVVPLNCAGYVSYLKLTNTREAYEKRFGRAFISRFSAVFNLEDTATFLWDTMDSFDSMSERFAKNNGYGILSCYYNIGVIMFSRERWIMMGKWPVNPSTSGMGEDEMFICNDGNEKDMAIYEFYDCLAGHLAFGHQKSRMMEYYTENYKKFEV